MARARSSNMPPKRQRLLAAVRVRMRHRAAVREAEHAQSDGRPVTAPAPAGERSRPTQPDHELDQLAAEARYHRERFQLYRARVISGSRVPTSPARLRELERAATAAEERLAHASRRDLHRGDDGQTQRPSTS
jgi:hypothetical protein